MRKTIQRASKLDFKRKSLKWEGKDDESKKRKADPIKKLTVWKSMSKTKV